MNIAKIAALCRFRVYGGAVPSDSFIHMGPTGRGHAVQPFNFVVHKKITWILYDLKLHWLTITAIRETSSVTFVCYSVR